MGAVLRCNCAPRDYLQEARYSWLALYWRAMRAAMTSHERSGRRTLWSRCCQGIELDLSSRCIMRAGAVPLHLSDVQKSQFSVRRDYVTVIVSDHESRRFTIQLRYKRPFKSQEKETNRKWIYINDDSKSKKYHLDRGVNVGFHNAA